MNMNGQNYEDTYKIRVKSGDLAVQGTGSVAIMPMPNNKYRVRMSLPDTSGINRMLDLTTIETVELVKTRIGWFGKGKWVKPLVVTMGALGFPYVLPAPLLFGLSHMGYTKLADLIFMGASTGASYASGVYTGTRLTRLARFVVMTQDGRHAVLEGPEPVFHFMNGVYAAPNIQLETRV